MDIDYLQVRERISRRLATTSPSRSARAAHLAFARAYARLLAEPTAVAPAPGRHAGAMRDQAT
jgi:hypothetical protein